MDAKDRLYSAATQQFDTCIDRYCQKIKNCLWGMICHAYNEGVKDGKKKAKAEMKDKIQIGDEVRYVYENGDVDSSNSFIVTDLDDDYISGIQLDGATHSHDEPGCLSHWEKTGRHFNIVEVLNKMADELFEDD